MRRAGEISAAAAARVLEVDRRTTVRWAKRALAGDPAPITHARRDAVGRYFLDLDEVRERARGASIDSDPSRLF